MLRAGIRLAQLADIERLQWVEIDAGQRFHAVGLHAIAEDDPPAGEVLAAKVAQGRLWWRSGWEANPLSTARLGSSATRPPPRWTATPTSTRSA